MSGAEASRPDQSGQEWFELIDPATEQVAGEVTRSGEVRSTDPGVVERVRSAFSRDLLVENGELAEELGVCFAGVSTIQPGDPAHNDLVFRNLGRLTGLIPRRFKPADEA